MLYRTRNSWRGPLLHRLDLLCLLQAKDKACAGLFLRAWRHAERSLTFQKVTQDRVRINHDKTQQTPIPSGARYPILWLMFLNLQKPFLAKAMKTTRTGPKRPEGECQPSAKGSFKRHSWVGHGRTSLVLPFEEGVLVAIKNPPMLALLLDLLSD